MSNYYSFLKNLLISADSLTNRVSPGLCILKLPQKTRYFHISFITHQKPVYLINIWSEYFIVITLLKSSAISKYKHFLKTKDPLLTDILEYWFLSHDNTVCGKHVHSIIARISFFQQDNIVYPLFTNNTPTTKFE